MNSKAPHPAEAKIVADAEFKLQKAELKRADTEYKRDTLKLKYEEMLA